MPLTRGRLSRLAELRLRFVPAIFGALAIQLVIFSLMPDGSAWIHRALHLVSYGLAALFLLANRKLAGLWVVALGAGLNLVAIAANNGVMPASRSALRAAGIAPSRGFANSNAVAHPRLAALGDVFAVPSSWPLHNVYSAGDVIIAVGVVLTLHSLSRAPALRPSAAS